MRASNLNKFRVSYEVDQSLQPLPDRELLESVLSRAVYDLTPEASIENRRSAIQWFDARDREDIKDADLLSWQRVKWELSLGCRFTRLVAEVLADAKAFQKYAVDCKAFETKPDIAAWVVSRKQYRALNQKPGMPSIAFRKSSLVEV